MIGNKPLTKILFSAAVISSATLTASLAVHSSANAKTLELQNHEINLGFRPRVAYVDAPLHAKSASVLFRFSAKSEWTDTFMTMIEVDHVELGFEDDFTNGVNFTGRPVIPDVEGTDVNQLYLSYSVSNTADLLVGRQVLNLGNERFVGSNSFWQNEQSVDALGFDYAFGSASTLHYRFVDNVNRINGDDAKTALRPTDPNFEARNGLRPPNFLGDHSHDTHLIFAEIKESDHSTFQAYYFDMDIEEAKLLSNRTIGLRYDYKARFGRYKAFAHAELATQKRTQIADPRDVKYMNIGLGLGHKSRDLSIQYEVLGENNGASFVTPLSSLHDQNGWADKFLATPANGLQDLSAKLVWRLSPFKLDIRYHLFSSDADDGDIGKELDIDLSYKVSHNNSLLIRFADFKSDNPGFASETRVFVQYFYNL